MLVSLSFLVILLRIVSIASVQAQFVQYRCNNTYGNYTSNSTYLQNLNTLLSYISSNTEITYGFYNFSFGNNPNIANGIALCRGDVLLDDCRNCLNNATTKLLASCTNQMEAVVWYDHCMLRYTNRSIFGVMEDTPWYWIRNRYKVLDQNDFNRVVSDLLGSLLNEAATGNSTLKFAIGKANVTTNLTVYAYTQCTPDLIPADCGSCLSKLVFHLTDYFLPYLGGRFFRQSCSMRYEVFKFSNAFDRIAFTIQSPSSQTISSLSPTSPLSAVKVAGKASIPVKIVVAVTALCLLLFVTYFWLRRQKGERKKANYELGHEEEISSNIDALQIAYCDIKGATQDFAEANKLGRGGFGTVYKGLLGNGQEIAVKRLARNSMQGEVEFRTEVQLLAKLQHRHLVRLLGYSMAGEEKLLIYEYVPNASLDHFLFGKTKENSLDWHTRYKIIGGIARGLLYLHEDSRLRIVHRDLKAGNILLDSQLNPKIADFGLARLFQADQTHVDTERISGTFGYMAPEYTYRGVFSVKSDVYSFGVLVLEIICGKKISDIKGDGNMEDLISLVWRKWTEGTPYDVIDSTLMSASRDEIMRCIHIGLLCVQANPTNRPTMSLVNLMLSSESLSLPEPSYPAYVLQTSLTVEETQAMYNAEEESITELHPR